MTWLDIGRVLSEKLEEGGARGDNKDGTGIIGACASTYVRITGSTAYEGALGGQIYVHCEGLQMGLSPSCLQEILLWNLIHVLQIKAYLGARDVV